jgi:hypothetical protein
MSRASQPDKQNGTLSVHTIKASGHVRRSNRPNTRLHPTTTQTIKSTLAMREPSTQDIQSGGHPLARQHLNKSLHLSFDLSGIGIKDIVFRVCDAYDLSLGIALRK